MRGGGGFSDDDVVGTCGKSATPSVPPRCNLRLTIRRNCALRQASIRHEDIRRLTPKEATYARQTPDRFHTTTIPLTAPTAQSAPDQAAAAWTCCSTRPTTPLPPFPLPRPVFLSRRLPFHRAEQRSAAARAEQTPPPLPPSDDVGSPPPHRCAPPGRVTTKWAAATSRPPNPARL